MAVAGLTLRVALQPPRRKTAEDPQWHGANRWRRRCLQSEDKAIMDDARTQRTLDAIADLYLTGTTPAPGQPPVRLPPKLRMRQPPAPVSAPQADAQSNPAQPVAPTQPQSPAMESDAFSHEAPAATGPARPWREMREQRRQAQSQADLDDHQPFQFPTSGGNASAVSSPDQAAAPVDVPGVIRSQVVFLGNLPGFAGPWLAQYAQSQASSGHAVAVMHVHGDTIDLEVVYPLGMKPSPSAGLVPGMSESLIDVLDRLSRDTYAPVTRWLLHLPASADQPVLEMAHDLDHWTLICGADEAAVIAGERWLGRLLQEDHRPHRRKVSVAVMGSDESKAADVVRRIELAGNGLLSQPVELALSRKQMAPVNLRSMGSFGPSEELWQELLSYLSTSEPVVTPQAAAPFAIPDYRKIETLQTPEPELAASEELAEVAPQAESVEPSCAQPTVAVAEAPEPLTAATSAPGVPLDLSQWLTSKAVVLDARCPYQPDLQLALDTDGRLHILAHHRTGPLATKLMDLQQAIRWAVDHLPLLKLTQRDATFDVFARPQSHLFTRESMEAASLVGRLTSDIRLHLLLEAHVGQQTTWVAAPLN